MKPPDLNYPITVAADISSSTALSAAMERLWLSKVFRIYYKSIIALTVVGLAVFNLHPSVRAAAFYDPTWSVLGVLSIIALVLPYVIVCGAISATWKSGQIKTMVCMFHEAGVEIDVDGVTTSFAWDKVCSVRASRRYVYFDLVNRSGFFLQKEVAGDLVETDGDTRLNIE